MLIACFDFQETSYVQELANLARVEGARLESLVVDQSAASWLQAYDTARRLIQEADGFIIPNANLLVQQEWIFPDKTVKPANEYLLQLHERIAQGARLLVQPRTMELDAMNGFLARYELTATNVRIASADKLLFSIPRSAHSFRDPALFAGVHEVTLDDPFAVWYGGDSLPVLVMTDRERAINLPDDVEADWQASELACAAVWYNSEGGAVLALSGTGIHDSDVKRNPQLSTNIVRFLCGGPARRRSRVNDRTRNDPPPS